MSLNQPTTVQDVIDKKIEEFEMFQIYVYDGYK